MKIDTKTVYTVCGRNFDTYKEADDFYRTHNQNEILKKKEAYIRMMLSKSVYGNIFSKDNPDYKLLATIQADRPLVYSLLTDTDLLQEIINNLKQNKWD